MEQSLVSYTFGQAGILPQAVEDAQHRLAAHFQAAEPTADELAAWCQTLRTEAPHLFAPPRTSTEAPASVPEPPAWMTNPAERLTWARQQAPAPVKQKTQPPVMTPARQQEHDAEKNPVARLGKLYQWQAEDAQQRR